MLPPVELACGPLACVASQRGSRPRLAVALGTVAGVRLAAPEIVPKILIKSKLQQTYKLHIKSNIAQKNTNEVSTCSVK